MHVEGEAAEKSEEDTQMSASISSTEKNDRADTGRAGCNLCQNARSGEENEKERACYCDGRKGGKLLQRRPLTIPKCTF